MYMQEQIDISAGTAGQGTFQLPISKISLSARVSDLGMPSYFAYVLIHPSWCSLLTLEGLQIKL